MTEWKNECLLQGGCVLSRSLSPPVQKWDGWKNGFCGQIEDHIENRNVNESYSSYLVSVNPLLPCCGVIALYLRKKQWQQVAPFIIAVLFLSPNPSPELASELLLAFTVSLGLAAGLFTLQLLSYWRVVVLWEPTFDFQQCVQLFFPEIKIMNKA